jgi:hypothetical protein
MTKPRSTKEYRDGCRSFVDFAVRNCRTPDQLIVCPCKMCRLNRQHPPGIVLDHLIGGRGMWPQYKEWLYHGERPVYVTARVTAQVSAQVAEQMQARMAEQMQAQMAAQAKMMQEYEDKMCQFVEGSGRVVTSEPEVTNVVAPVPVIYRSFVDSRSGNSMYSTFVCYLVTRLSRVTGYQVNC